MGKNNGKIHTIDMVFPLLFLLMFCLCALLVVMQGARIYEGTAAGLRENYTVRTAVSYLQEKLRECGDASRVSVRETGGQQALLLDSEQGGELYTTCIYWEDGSLKELFARKDDFTGPAGGQTLTELDAFLVERPERDLFVLTVEAEGRRETVWIRMPADSAA